MSTKAQESTAENKSAFLTAFIMQISLKTEQVMNGSRMPLNRSVT